MKISNGLKNQSFISVLIITLCSIGLQSHLCLHAQAHDQPGANSSQEAGADVKQDVKQQEDVRLNPAPLAQNNEVHSPELIPSSSKQEPTVRQNQPASAIAEVVKQVVLPHLATYSVTLENNKSPDVVDIKGTMSIQVLSTRDGWDVRQKSNIIIYGTDDTADQVSTSLMTWESQDGLNFKFDSTAFGNGEVEEQLQGYVKYTAKNLVGTLEYDLPNKMQKDLPPNTLFPMEFLLSLMTIPKQYPHSETYLVFDGSNPLQEPVKVDALVRRHIKPNVNFSSSHFKPMNAYPMHLAIYSLENQGMLPDYTIEQVVLDGGVIKEMIIDKGLYQIKATLTDIQFFES